MPSHSTRPFFSLFLIVALLLAAPASAQPSSPPPEPIKSPRPDDVVGQLLLREETVDQVLVLLERWSGKTVLRPQALPSFTITVTLKGSVTRAEAIRALETLLTLNGVAVTSLDEKFLKVTPLANAKSEAPELIEDSTLGLPPSGRIASKVFQPLFLQVSELIPQVTPLLNSGTSSAPVIFEKANAALITDTISNLQRIETLMLRLDRPALTGMKAKFYQLQFAKASDVVNKMRTILSGPLQNRIGSATTFNPDDRTNQIVLVTDPRQYEFFDDLITKLDLKSGSDNRNEVIYLKHAAAKEVATILSQLVSGQIRQNGGNEIAPPVGRRTTVPNAAHPLPDAPAAAPDPAVAAPALIANLEAALEPSFHFSPLLTILPEERSNSVIVSGTVDDIRLIQDLVNKIDVLLAQVRIEVVIAEVTLSDNATSGINALGLQIEGDKLVGFSGSMPGLKVLDATITRPGVVGNGPRDLAATIALGTTPRKTNTNILSVPNIITTHNKEGKIFVGESRPVISSYLNETSNSGDVGAGYRSTINNVDIGIELTVKPLIGNDGSVQLEIKQAVDDVLGEVIIDGNPQPRIGKRNMESFVSSRNGEIIVLGGLQRNSKSRNTSRLGPIPIIGDLLGARSREDSRTDLVFFLRPMVLTNTPADNLPALQQLEKLPEAEREQIKRAVAPTTAAAR